MDEIFLCLFDLIIPPKDYWGTISPWLCPL
jgi:hypothetical protein